MWQLTKLPVHKTLSVACCCRAVTVWQHKVRHVSGVLHYCQGQWDNKGALWISCACIHTWRNCKSICSSTALGPLSLIFHILYAVILNSVIKTCPFFLPSCFQSALIMKSRKAQLCKPLVRAFSNLQLTVKPYVTTVPLEKGVVQNKADKWCINILALQVMSACFIDLFFDPRQELFGARLTLMDVCLHSVAVIGSRRSSVVGSAPVCSHQALALLGRLHYGQNSHLALISSGTGQKWRYSHVRKASQSSVYSSCYKELCRNQTEGILLFFLSWIQHQKWVTTAAAAAI